MTKKLTSAISTLITALIVRAAGAGLVTLVYNTVAWSFNLPPFGWWVFFVGGVGLSLLFGNLSGEKAPKN